MHNIQNMFASATLKLTAWYLLGIMVISITFSFLVYNLALGELSARLGVIGTSLEERGDLFMRFNYSSVRERQYEQAAANLLTILVYSNIVIFGVARVGSYLWARRTLQPIEQAHEAQSRFTSDASHELRTPLAVIQAEIEAVLRDKKASNQELRATLTSNLEEVKRLSKLSTVLLKIAQAENQTVDWHEINLQELTSQAIRTLAKNQQPRIHLKPNKKPPKTHGSPESIKELIIILLQNAIKYSPANSPITVRAFRERGKHCVSIQNTGEGISEKDIDNIFRRFYRADTSRTNSATEGYGLGLSLAEKIAELHHGEIAVESTPQKTTTFTIKLP